MILTVAQYLEAFETPEGRFRSLRRIILPRDGMGEPTFAVPAVGLVDFDVVADGEALTLRCPLRWDADFAHRLGAFAHRDDGLGGRFFTEWRVLEREVTLFGAGGAPREVDVLARPTPRGSSLTDFLSAAMSRGDWDAVCRASESFEELARWAATIPRAVSRRRLVVSAEGEVTVSAFSTADGVAHIREMLRAARRRMGIPEPRVPNLAPNRAPILAPNLAAGYEEATWDAEWGVAVVMTEGRWSMLDCDGVTISARDYDWLGECSEGLVLAVREGRCGFLDTSGDEVIPCVWEDASSFSGGVALVGSEGESFFIDRRGERI